MSDEIEIDEESALGRDLVAVRDELDDAPLRHPSYTIPGKMEIIMRKCSRLVFRYLPEVRKLDPDETSKIVAALRDCVRELFGRYQAWCIADNFPDVVPEFDDRPMPAGWLNRTKWGIDPADLAMRAKEEADREVAGYLSIETERRLDWFLDFVIKIPLDSARKCASTIIETYETMGLTPNDIERLMDRYEVKPRSFDGLIEWETIDELKEKAFMSRLRSDSALRRGPSVSDEQIKLVVSTRKGQEAQAKVLGISVRQLQRRLRKIKEKA